jgi:hypothetical protein
MTIRDALRLQGTTCAGLGSPFMGQMLTTLADKWPDNSPLGQICAKWTGDIGPSGVSLPLRIAAGLHALALTDRAPRLRDVYPPHSASDTTLIKEVLTALIQHQDFMRDWIKSPPQTNEVRRSAALIAAAHWIAARHDLPFITSELGASGGLNLMWDRFALDTGQHILGPANPALTLSPDWTGPTPAPTQIHVTERRGVDLNPVNADAPDDALRLFAYLWPDQPHRLDLTRKAIAVLDAKVDKGDAIDWLAPRLSTAKPGHIHLIYHTIAWQYFPAPVQSRGAALIKAAGQRATADAPLAWLRIEADGNTPGASLTLRLWPGDLRITLGRIDFHGRWVHWTAQ